MGTRKSDWFPLRIFIFSFLLATFSYASAQVPSTNNTSSCPSCGPADKLTAVMDAKGNRAFQFEYDLLGRLIRDTDPFGNSLEFSYDSVGNIIKKKDQSGNVTEYTYDSLGRLIKKKFSDDSVEEFKYDSRGNIIYAGNQWIAYDLSYDSKARLIAVTDSNGRVIRYEYDVMDNRTKMIAPDGKVITYKYDANNRLIEISSEGQIFTFVYNILGRRIKLSYPNGAYATYAYDTNKRLTNLTHKKSNSAVINSFTYTHDNVGNRMTKTEPDKKTTYSYDAKYRLTEAVSSAPGYSSNKTGKGRGISNATQRQKEFYTYDSVGNRLTSDHNRTYTYNAGNQLIAENGIAYSYDKNGNLITKVDADGTTIYAHYAYDYENRLIRVVKPDGIVVEFRYDPFGRRIEKKVTEDGIATVKRYFYDNEDILFEYDESGNIGNRYIHGLGIDEPLALINGHGNYYYHADGLGSVVALTDTGQTVIQTYEYDSFGNLKDQKERIKQPYTFTAREWDKEIGLYYYRARYYDANVGRFTTKDPSLIFSKDFKTPYLLYKQLTSPQSLNYYVYGTNNPINRKDPWGLDDLSDLEPDGTIGSPQGSIFTCRQIARKIRQEGNEKYPGNRNNHMRHCWASCRLAQLGGSACAFTAGWAQETIGIYDPADIEANAKGRECSSSGDCVKCCEGCKP